MPPPPPKTVPFVEPSTPAALGFCETFGEDWESRWIRSANEKFSGKWERVLRKVEALSGDHGLRVMEKAKHHGISTRFTPVTTADRGLVVSYEAKFEDDLSCGGAYLKVFDSNGMDMKEFTNETPYV